METSPHWLLERIGRHGARPFLHSPAGPRTYAELADAVAREIQRRRDSGVGAGAVVAIVSDYGFEAIAVLLALVANHDVVVPIASGTDAEIADRLEVAGVGAVCRIQDGSARWSTRPAAEAPPLLRKLADENRAGLILFSSGSTGRPKAMVHDLDRLLDSYRDRKARDLTILVFLLFDHIGGLNTLFTALASGTAMVVPVSREPDAVGALIARHRVAILPTSPTFLNLLLLSGAPERHDLSSLRIITYGTEPMPESLLLRLRRGFPKVKFIQTFGTSETGITATRSKSSDSTLLSLADPDFTCRLVEGELWLRSRTQILGYLNHPMSAFTDDGWFKTGDLAETAGDGFLRIIGRRSEIINVGGEKVLPVEVESVLLALPEIADCLVSGEPSVLTGQVVRAQVVLAPGADPAGIRKKVRMHCRDRLAAYKIPVKVEVVPGTEFTERFKKRRASASS